MLALAGCGGDDDEAGGTGDETTAEGPEGEARWSSRVRRPGPARRRTRLDGESFRPITQIFETLVALAPGTTEPEPGLAESEAERGRHRVDVQDPRGRGVPRRRALQR